MSENDDKTQPEHKQSRWVGVVLGVIAVLMMAGAYAYQKRTGPTYDLRGEFELGGQIHKYKLVRSHVTDIDAPVEIPDPGGDVTATLHWKRLGMDEPHTPVVMLPEHREAKTIKLLGLIPIEISEKDLLVGRLPFQPPAGKLEYYLTLNSAESEIIIPQRGSADDREVVIRFKGAVPNYWLVPHIIFMFFGILFGMRTFLSALFNRRSVRWLAWTTLVLLFIGGLILGPIVQLYAFGAAWTGVPFGWDLTDNKTLVMFVFWLAACLAVGTRGRVKSWTRWAVAVAAIVMIITYLVPHSMYGSTLNYEKLEEGVDPVDAIGQG